MKNRSIEIIATILVVLVLVGTPFAITHFSPWKSKNGEKVIFLTGVASQGIWTEDRVNGMNYWNTQFKKATILLKLGEEVTFRFTSLDVTHSFYAPELGIGPIYALPGVVSEFKYKATKTGKFTYYCTTFCGQCHLFMQGFINVIDGNDYQTACTLLASEKDKLGNQCTCYLLQVPENATYKQRGELLFKIKGCYSCHGVNGQGGVVNPNYANKTIPTLNNLASKLFLRNKEDAGTIVKLLETKKNLDTVAKNPPFRNYNRFLAQYQSVVTKIHNGAPNLQRLDSTSYMPPLLMPSWENYLTDEEINSIIVYFISINNWNAEPPKP